MGELIVSYGLIVGHLPTDSKHGHGSCIAVGQNQWYHIGVGAPPILEPILVGIESDVHSGHGLLTHGNPDLFNLPLTLRSLAPQDVQSRRLLAAAAEVAKDRGLGAGSREAGI